jgi:CheY-like chemotaxis protein
MRQIRAGLDSVRNPAVVIASCGLFLYLILWNVQLTFQPIGHLHLFLFALVEYGFSACVAFTYLAVGLVAWLYVRDRLVGRLLLAFSLFVMAVFAMQTAAALINNVVSEMISSYGSSIGLYLLSVLFLVFPRNFLARRPGKGRSAALRPVLPRVYLAGLSGLLACDIAGDPLTAMLWQAISRHRGLFQPASGGMQVYWATLAFLLCSVVPLVITYFRAQVPHQRQQVRIVGIGLLLAYLPFFVGTVLPLSVIPNPSLFLQNSGQFTTVFFILIPLALGYAVLRYHVLLVDRHIHSAVTVLVGGVLLAVCAYLVFFFCSILLPDSRAIQVLSAAFGCLLVIAAVWRIAPWVSHRIFAPDLAATHRLLYGDCPSPASLTSEDDPVEVVARRLMQSALTVLGARQVCFLAFHRESDSYRPAFLPGDGMDSRVGSPHPLLSLLEGSLLGDQAKLGWLDAREPLWGRLAGAERPLLLSEARATGAWKRTSFARVLAAPQEEENPLLVPLKTRKEALIGSKLAGVLVLGARDTYLPYAGPDLALIDILLVRFSWQLEAALIETQTRQHISMLNALSTPPVAPPLVVERAAEELAGTYASVVTTATGSSAEIWLYSERDAHLRRVARSGPGPFLRQAQSMMPGEESDWACWFYEGEEEPWREKDEQTRPRLLDPPDFPFAWLPLRCRDLPVGVLVLTYHFPHHLFSPAERQILELFANQIATALESARVAGSLRTEATSQRARTQAKGEALLEYMRHLLRPLVEVQRYLGARRTPDGRLEVPGELNGEQYACQDEASHSAEAFAPALCEALSRLINATRESLSLLQALSGTPGEISDQEAIAAAVRWQVNDILRGFEDTRQPVLVVTADADFGTLLVSALNIDGYTPSLVPSRQEALLWVRQHLIEERDPAALILDCASFPGEMDLVDFSRDLQAAWPSAAHEAPPLLLVSAGDSAPPSTSGRYALLEAPFSVHAFLERVRACIRRPPAAGD